MSRWNGRFHPLGEDERPNDPKNDFPMRETFQDFAGQERLFEITLRDVKLGFLVEAEEVGKNGHGYEFAAFDAPSPYLALYELRGKLRRMLCTRHLEKAPDGQYLPAHKTLRGRITGDADTGEPMFVLDGIALSLQEFAKLIQTHEGFQFSLRFFDPAEEVG